jgi:hypothetical protein
MPPRAREKAAGAFSRNDLRAAPFLKVCMQKLAEAWIDIASDTINSDALREAHQGRGQCRVLGDVNLFTISKARLELLGQHSSSGEATDELQPTLRTKVGAALVNQDRAHDVAIAARDRGSAIYVGQHDLAVRYAAASLRLAGSNS